MNETTLREALAQASETEAIEIFQQTLKRSVGCMNQTGRLYESDRLLTKENGNTLFTWVIFGGS